MKEIYKRIWELAKPYYQQGRPYDIPHIEWIMRYAEKISDEENLNKDLLIPICILHDVGYSQLEKKNHPAKDPHSKKIHMKEGAKIAKDILKKVNYDKKLTKKIIYYISVHDNWIFGDNKPFKECKEMAVFNDLDFLYALSDMDVVKHASIMHHKTPKEIAEFWEKDEKLINRPFCCCATKKLFEESISEIKDTFKS